MQDMRENDVVLILADVSGYTSFIASNQKALAHSQLIISELIKAILSEVDLPLNVAKLEGDAVFMYAFKEGNEQQWVATKRLTGEKLLAFFYAFQRKLTELITHSICNCDACANINMLQLKIVAHSGRAILYENELNGSVDLSSVDVILAHRLLKNSVQERRYILLTEQAAQDIEVSDLPPTPGEEYYDELGTVKTLVYPAPNPDDMPPTPDEGLPYTSIFVSSLRDEIQHEYSKVATTPDAPFHFHTGRRLTQKVGYKDAWLEGIPESSVESAAGTGTPFALGELKPGEYVVDVGCGAGMDCLIAARMVGPTGKVIGVDMTPSMLEKARRSADELGLTNVEFRQGFAEELPVEDGWADVVISNGAINLVPDKVRTYAEIKRILKPHGRLQIVDILIEKPIPDNAKKNIDLWAG